MKKTCLILFTQIYLNAVLVSQNSCSSNIRCDDVLSCIVCDVFNRLSNYDSCLLNVRVFLNGDMGKEDTLSRYICREIGNGIARHSAKKNFSVHLSLLEEEEKKKNGQKSLENKIQGEYQGQTDAFRKQLKSIEIKGDVYNINRKQVSLHLKINLVDSGYVLYSEQYYLPIDKEIYYLINH